MSSFETNSETNASQAQKQQRYPVRVQSGSKQIFVGSKETAANDSGRNGQEPAIRSSSARSFLSDTNSEEEVETENTRRNVPSSAESLTPIVVGSTEVWGPGTQQK